MDLSRF